MVASIAVAAALLALPAPAAVAAGPYPDAVVLVSGYNSSTAFTTPDASCAGQEGPTWSQPTGPAAALRAAGRDVFTAPVQRGDDPILPACAPGGQPVPPPATYIDSYGDDDANGAALGSFLAFLRDSYGVESVRLVVHSDGGNWSRSALTQDAAYAGLAVESLTSLGTPYTGSMVADVATSLDNASCDFSNAIEQKLCREILDLVRLAYFEAGPTAVKQLTHSYLASWNRQQSIGACPVTTIAGTGVDLPLLPFSFYNPSDGLVGLASAQARKADALPDLAPIAPPNIPGRQSGGTLPVVHAASLSVINPANLLNTQAISDEVAEIVAAVPNPVPLCNGSADGATGVEDDALLYRHVEPFRLTRVPGRKGGLGRARGGDVVVARASVGVRCDGEALDPLPLLGDERVGLVLGDSCDGRLASAADGDRAKGRPAAMLMRAHPARLVVTRAGRGLAVETDGARVRRLRLEVSADGKTKRLELDRKGRARLPRGDTAATLEASARSRGGRRLDATLVLSR